MDLLPGDRLVVNPEIHIAGQPPLTQFDLLGDIIGDDKNVDGARVAPEVMQELARPHSKARPGVPFSWMVSYSGRRARGNVRVFENGVRHCSLEFPVRVYFSTFSEAIVVSFVPLDAVREAHILDFFDTFYEVPVEEAKARLEKFPDWPYDGRNRDLAHAELRAGPAIEELLKKSRERLRALGVLPLGRYGEAMRDD